MTIQQIKRQFENGVQAHKEEKHKEIMFINEIIQNEITDHHFVKSVKANRNKNGFFDIVIELSGSVTERELKRLIYERRN